MTDTGEIVEQIAPDDARVLTDQIRFAVEASWELIRQAYMSRAWAALQYSSWDDYCTREFGGSRLRLPREERQEVVGSLRDAGLSIRAIASATGDSRGTVHRSFDAAGVPFGTPDTPDDNESIPDEESAPPSRPAAKPIKGTDGKTYKAKDMGSPTDTLKTAATRLSHTRAAVQARVEKARKMAADGYTSRQIAPIIGVGIEGFTTFKSRHGITVPADAVVGKAHRIDHDRVVESAVSGVAGECAALSTIGYDLNAVDPANVDGWVSSLTKSIKFLNQFRTQLKEKTQP